MRDVRHFTNRLISMVEDGVISAEVVAQAALKYMSEDDVADLFHHNAFCEGDDGACTCDDDEGDGHECQGSDCDCGAGCGCGDDDCPGPVPGGFEVSVTYEVITPESAAEGDVADAGHDLAPEIVPCAGEVAAALRRGGWGWSGWSSSPAGAGDWLVSDFAADYRTAEETAYSGHVRPVLADAVAAAEIVTWLAVRLRVPTR
jgi:hypothetical protein